MKQEISIFRDKVSILKPFGKGRNFKVKTCFTFFFFLPPSMSETLMDKVFISCIFEYVIPKHRGRQHCR